MSAYPRFGPLLDEFLDSLAAAKRSDNTIAGYRNDLIGIAAVIAGAARDSDAGSRERLARALTLDRLDRRGMLRGFAAWASTHSAGSQRRAWTVWNRFFERLVDDEAIARNPMRAIDKPRAPRHTPRAIDDDDAAAKLLAVAAAPDPSARPSKAWPERDVALIALYCVTGVRLAEGVGLTLSSIDGPAGERRLHVTGKGNRERTIPIEPALETLIERYLATRRSRREDAGADPGEPPTAPLFVDASGNPLSRSQVQYLVRRLYARAALRPPQGALVHALRHTFATTALQNGVDVVEVRDLLGHASLATTSRYLDATAQRLREAVKAHPAQAALRSAIGDR